MKPFDFLANAVRAKEIVTVLARHGFADLVEQIEPATGFWGKMVPRPRTRRSTWERIRLAAEDLGPTFIKFGQLLSMRPDVIPEPLVLELRRLQDGVSPLPFDDMLPVILEEMETPLEVVFSEFDQTPVASASLAQVYCASLREGDRPVAVKVQRPNVNKIVELDFEIIAWFAQQAHQRVPAMRPYDLPGVVEEIREGIRQELDFRNEARNVLFFNAQNPYNEAIFAPAAYEELTTRRLLVMEYVPGKRLEAASLPVERGRYLADQGAKSMFHQILLAGFFHADPHGGNVMIAPDGRICLLDWGLVGQLTRRMRHFLADLFTAACDGDAERVVQIAISIAGAGPRPDARTMEKEVTFALREDLNYLIGRQEIGRTILRLLHVFGSNGINVTHDFSLMAKAVLSIEEVGRLLDPDFDLRESSRPVLRDLQSERWNPRYFWKNARYTFGNALARLQDLPADLDRILRRLGQDDLTINFQHKGLENLDDALKTASNRVTLGVIIGSLVIGSSLIVTTGIRPYLFGYPAFGIVGYLMSAVLGLWVVWDIVRHGRHR